MKDRKQLNLRLDNEGELLEEIKEAARLQEISLNQFVVNALKAAIDKPVASARQPLDNTLDRIDALEKKWEALHQELKEIKARQPLDKQLDKDADRDRDPGSELLTKEPSILDDLLGSSLDRGLDKMLDESTLDSRLYTDGEVAKQWDADCTATYIKEIRLGKRVPVSTDRDIFDYWQPVEGKAKWRKIKSVPRALRSSRS